MNRKTSYEILIHETKFYATLNCIEVHRCNRNTNLFFFCWIFRPPRRINKQGVKEQIYHVTPK